MESKKKAKLSILVSDKIDFKPTKIKRDKVGHYIMVKKINAKKRANDTKYKCTQYRSTHIYNASS